jgi:hypothetical protein
MSAERNRRLAFAIPPIAEPGADAQHLDPADPDDRSMLIRAAIRSSTPTPRPSRSTTTRSTRGSI